MLAHERVLPKVVGAALAAATLFGTLPKPAAADPVRATNASENDGNNAKKSKRKRTWVASWPRRRHGTAFAPLPIAAVKKTPAEIAVATARKQIGKPYRWGGSGPSSFDCSGLTRFAWAAAGVHLPHGSRAQFGSLPRVPLDELRPGDLVYRPGHIGIYVGKGKMIHAPQSGRRVEVAPLKRLIGAARPD